MRWTCALLMFLSFSRTALTSERSLLSVSGFLTRSRLASIISSVRDKYGVDLQGVRHGRGCGVSPCDQHVEHLVADKTYVLILVV